MVEQSLIDWSIDGFSEKPFCILLQDKKLYRTNERVENMMQPWESIPVVFIGR